MGVVVNTAPSGLARLLWITPPAGRCIGFCQSLCASPQLWAGNVSLSSCVLSRGFRGMCCLEEIADRLRHYLEEAGFRIIGRVYFGEMVSQHQNRALHGREHRRPSSNWVMHNTWYLLKVCIILPFSLPPPLQNMLPFRGFLALWSSVNIVPYWG